MEKGIKVKEKSGFTLIELLVVVAIIGILASVVLASLNSARAKARDTRRKSDIRQIRTALDLYYATYGRYVPEILCQDTSIGTDPACNGSIVNTGDWVATSDLRNLITEGFLSSLPKDPTNNPPYYYLFEPDNVGQGTPPCTTNTCRYILCANRLEVTGSQYCIGVE